MQSLRAFLILCLAMGFAGCAKRQLHITSEPSGALVYLNGQEVGRTPMRHDFVFYGDYDVVLRREGYETLKTHRKLNAPLHEIPPIDLFAEMLGTKDVRHWNFELAQAGPQAVDPLALIGRGEALKGELRSSQYTRSPAPPPTTRPTTGPTTRPTE